MYSKSSQFSFKIHKIQNIKFYKCLRKKKNDRTQVDLRHMDEQVGSNVVDFGVDLSEFYMSVEWDILEVPAVR